MNAYPTLRDEAWQANQGLAQSGLVLETFGNVSVLDRTRGVFAIKPSGVPYSHMTPEDIVVVDLEGAVVWGHRNPSSDTPTHRVLYRSFPTLGGVCHTHSTYATAWAQARLDIPALGTTHADFLPQAVPCTDPLTDAQIAGDYEIETGLAIVPAFGGDQPRRRAHGAGGLPRSLHLGNHGAGRGPARRHPGKPGQDGLAYPAAPPRCAPGQ